MTCQHEDEPPTIHHRSAFDTIPAPPPSFEVIVGPVYIAGTHHVMECAVADARYGVGRKPSDPTMISTIAHVIPADAPIHLTRAGKESLVAAGVDLSKPVTLSFEGGEVELPQPTRADLVLSAQQWATAIREHLVDWNAHTDSAKGMLDRLDAILKELADATR